ncbi:hypothetical protein WME99_41355 [Sorangium sp. So ce136]|uniref:hypothetical protein n=1 Tax=Sorangium sp. So ce136 TaxID=3133284 RepID=UPI003F0D5AA3
MIKDVAGNVGPIPVVVPPGGTARFTVTMKGAWTDRLQIVDTSGKVVKEFVHQGGSEQTKGSWQLDSHDGAITVFMYGAHKEPGNSDYLNDKWTTFLNTALEKEYGWEDFGDSDFRDIFVHIDIHPGTYKK